MLVTACCSFEFLIRRLHQKQISERSGLGNNTEEEKSLCEGSVLLCLAGNVSSFR